jgi:hypothetical protein
VLVYCPACGCAWRDPREAPDATTFQELRDLGVSSVRGATAEEIAAAGFAGSVLREEADWRVP